jgi:GT2 family glycosyltransferase
MSIVVVTFNSAREIGHCVESVIRELSADDEMIIIDNASTDSTPALLTLEVAKLPGVTVVLSSRNLGFSAATNLGFRMSSSTYLCMLNPDTVAFPGLFAELQRVLQDPSVGAAGPLSNNIGARQFVGHHLLEAEQSGLSAAQLHSTLSQRWMGQVEETKLLIGCCLAVRRDTLNVVGLLDESMYLGSEDVELSWRLRSHGLKLMIAKAAFVQHAGGASFGSIDSSLREQLVAESTRALVKKISFHHADRIPGSIELWGCNIVQELP